MPIFRPSWPAPASGREAWHLVAGVAAEGAADRRTPQIVARSLCRFLRVDYGKLPQADRRRHLEVQLAAWAPFPQPDFALIEGASAYAVFAWDAAALAERAGSTGLPWPPPSLWPESVFTPPPAPTADAAAMRLLPCREGCEAQFWQQGELMASRWWPQWPGADAWLNFQRGARVPEAARLEAPPAVQSWPGTQVLGAPWAIPVTLQALREREQLPQHALAAAGLLALLLPTLWLGADHWRTAAANEALAARVQELETAAQPVLKVRADALEGLSALEMLGPAFARTDPLALLAHLSQRLDAAGGALIRELDWNGTRLRLVLSVPASQPRVAYVQALEDGDWLRDVREDTQDAEPGTLALVAGLAVQAPDRAKRAAP